MISDDMIGDDDDDDDDDIEMGGITQALRCPLTLTAFEDAHTRSARPFPPV